MHPSQPTEEAVTYAVPVTDGWVHVTTARGPAEAVAVARTTMRTTGSVTGAPVVCPNPRVCKHRPAGW